MAEFCDYKIDRDKVRAATKTAIPASDSVVQGTFMGASMSSENAAKRLTEGQLFSMCLTYETPGEHGLLSVE